MQKAVFLSKNAAQSKRIADELVKSLLKGGRQKEAVVLALSGELGAGKTTFVQGLAKALGVKEKITSPTFVILKRFTLNSKLFPERSPRSGASRKVAFENLYHIDCYRLTGSRDLISLGLKEILKDPKNLVVIEWAEKVKPLLPRNTSWLKFKWAGKSERLIEFKEQS